jgi:hypothetical protein
VVDCWIIDGVIVTVFASSVVDCWFIDGVQHLRRTR